MTNLLVEIIASSADDCAAIEAAGAHRIELCAALVLGGLTPSFGTIAEAKARTSLPIMAMVRPREAGMAYSEAEFATMERDADAALEAGADGIVFGVLNENGTLDRERMKRLVGRAGGRQTVCHRAFDVTPDPFEAFETLIDLGITRVLTSGQKPSAPEGADLIAKLIDRAAGRIEVLPGAGITPANVADLVARTGCDQVHLAAFTRKTDPSGMGNPSVQFSGAEPPPEGEFDTVDTELIGALLSVGSNG